MKLRDAGEYEILFDLSEGEYQRTEVGGIRTRTIRAGESLEVECYPLTRIGGAARTEARRRQNDFMLEVNRRITEKKIRRLIEQNFTTEDWVLTLTYDYGAVDKFRRWGNEAQMTALGIPEDDRDVKRDLKNYWRRIKREMSAHGEDAAEFKHIWKVESTKGDTQYHAHVVVHAPGLTREELQRLWPYGAITADNLRLGDGGAAGLARYLSKRGQMERADESGSRIRRWGHSKNLKEPRVTVSDRKVSRRRAQLVAEDVQRNGREIFEALYPGYQAIEVTVKFSGFVAGAYIFARLRKIDTEPPWVRKGRRQE